MCDVALILMVFFDFGNVLCPFSREVQARALAALPTTRPLAEILQFIEGSVDHLAYEMGIMTREDFLSRLSHYLETPASLQQVEDAYATLFSPNEPMWQLAEAISKLLPVGLATNSDPSHVARAKKDYPKLSLFRDKLVTSFEAGARKPSPEFFAAMVRVSGLPAESLCFIDDLPANVEGAKAVGIKHALIFDGNVKKLVSDLASLGITLG